MRTIVVACVLALTAALAGSAGAITNGQPDGNAHPYVGVLLMQMYDAADAGGALRPDPHPLCTGTYIGDEGAGPVFLTANHCTARFDELAAEDRLEWVGVSFDTDPAFYTGEDGRRYVDVDETSNVIAATSWQGAGYPGGRGDTKDLALVSLASDPGVAAAALAPVGFLPSLGRQRLAATPFVNVGYGRMDRQLGGGAPVHPEPIVRMWSVSSFSALNKTVLRLSQNPSTGDGGTCFGDSGGPQLVRHAGVEYVVSITSTGDATCRATNVTYRVDTRAAQVLLAPYYD